LQVSKLLLELMYKKFEGDGLMGWLLLQRTTSRWDSVAVVGEEGLARSG
jgi:hypothetical protein